MTRTIRGGRVQLPPPFQTRGGRIVTGRSGSGGSKGREGGQLVQLVVGSWTG